MEAAQIIPGKVWGTIAGEAITEIPQDLFIPPDALEVLLDSFSGPLDLLLYLIRKQNLNILDIPILQITDQYMHYIELIGKKKLELAADYLAMAALLAEIKSRLLLPPRKTEEAQETEEDPRMTLVRRLQTYEQFKEAALCLDRLPRCERDTFLVQDKVELLSNCPLIPPIVMDDLIQVMQQLQKRQAHLATHQITRETLCVHDRMNLILTRLKSGHILEMTSFVTRSEGRNGLIVTFLAILELSRQALILVMQTAPFASLHIQTNS